MRLRSGFLLTLLLGAGHTVIADILYSVTDLGPGAGYGINCSGSVGNGESVLPLR
jgi:hypothetical protein